MVDRDLPEVSVVRQCELLNISRSSVHYRPAEASEHELELMGLMTSSAFERPSTARGRWPLGSGVKDTLSIGSACTELMRLMGLEAIYRRPSATRADSRHKLYPYLLRDLQIDKVNQV